MKGIVVSEKEPVIKDILCEHDLTFNRYIVHAITGEGTKVKQAEIVDVINIEDGEKCSFGDSFTTVKLVVNTFHGKLVLCIETIGKEEEPKHIQRICIKEKFSPLKSFLMEHVFGLGPETYEIIQNMYAPIRPLFPNKELQERALKIINGEIEVPTVKIKNYEEDSFNRYKVRFPEYEYDKWLYEHQEPIQPLEGNRVEPEFEFKRGEVIEL
ncbi:MAG TPA: hypothetical protein DCP90_02245 [Clostridiales bacterium]|nr:MAG: hypothetical protein A2Y22_00380 [Clostridiales bacterium GWD2_32_59]HAN09415.1 hypothetical protein [Clostridiales bacterium]